MKKLVQTFSLRFSPDTSGFEVGDGRFLLHATVPYDERGLTIQINPAVSEHIESLSAKGFSVKNLTVTEGTNESQKIYISLDDNDKFIKVDGKRYILKLQRIEKYMYEGQEFPEYYLFVEEQ